MVLKLTGVYPSYSLTSKEFLRIYPSYSLTSKEFLRIYPSYSLTSKEFLRIIGPVGKLADFDDEWAGVDLGLRRGSCHVKVITGTTRQGQGRGHSQTSQGQQCQQDLHLCVRLLSESKSNRFKKYIMSSGPSSLSEMSKQPV